MFIDKRMINKVRFKVLDKGPILKKKYHNDLHCFGDEVKGEGKEDILKFIAHIGPKNSFLEVTYWDGISVNEIIKFLEKYKIKVEKIAKK